MQVMKAYKVKEEQHYTSMSLAWMWVVNFMSRRKGPQVLLECRAGWASDSVWAQGRREDFLASGGDTDMAKKMIKCSYENYSYDLI